MASQISVVSIACPTVCSGAAQRKYQNSAALAFVRGILRWLNIHKHLITKWIVCYMLLTEKSANLIRQLTSDKQLDEGVGKTHVTNTPGTVGQNDVTIRIRMTSKRRNQLAHRKQQWQSSGSGALFILFSMMPKGDCIRNKMIPDSKFHGANMGPSGAERTQVGPMLVPWTLLSGIYVLSWITNLVARLVILQLFSFVTG